MLTFSNILQQLPKNITECLDVANKNELDINNLEIDHFCIRTAKIHDTETMKQNIIDFGAEVISQNVVNERIIYVLKLFKPIRIFNFKIDCIELPCPAKEHKFPVDGFEHLEFSFELEKISSTEEFVNLFLSKNKHLKINDLEINIPNIIGKQLLNPTINFHSTSPMRSIKFHPYSIEKVVKTK